MLPPPLADPMQLVDELSMIYTTCLMAYATFSYSRSRLFSLLLALFLISLAVFITLYYHYLQDPAFHQNAYAILTVVVLVRAMWVMELTLRPSLRQSENEYRSQHGGRSMDKEQQEISRWKDRRDGRILGTMWVMIACGLSTFLGGFAIWGLDNVYCSTLREWRREIGLPWGILLEGHGWW
jgi:dihydroceramidase